MRLIAAIFSSSSFAFSAAAFAAALRWDKIDYPDTDQWGSFKAQQKLHFKAVFHAVH